MNQYSNVEDIKKFLADTNVYVELFDVTRIVDANLGKVIEMRDGAIIETPVNCVDVFGCKERCKNCTSIRALYSNEQVVKLEYVNNSILFIMSLPVILEEQHLVVELVKDITSSMTVECKDDYRADEVSYMIDRFNKLATTDQLTNLMNRRFIDERLPNVIQASQLMGKAVGILMIDIDFFKKINDSYGHQAGDHVLSELARILSSFVHRESDFAARYGGEEFMMCFPGMPIEMCQSIGEKIRAHVEGHVFQYGGMDIRISVSIGVASSAQLPDPTQKSLIALADERLYRPKQNGRNQVVWT